MRLGFIGCGNMAGAIIAGIIKKGLVSPDEIYGSNSTPEHANATHERLGIQTTTDNTLVAGESDIVFLCVKPQQYEAVIDQIKDHLHEHQILVSIAPGKTLAWLEEQFGKKVKIVRTMPNTPALVGEGMTAACPNDAVTEEEKNYALELLSSFGKVEIVPEHLIDAVVAVSGSSPAYIFMIIEAMADGAVAEGMPRLQAYQFAAQAVLGSAKMVLETGKHPGELKDMVCSPAGTTIEAVRVLEKFGLRSAVIEAEKVCADMSRNM